MKIKKDAMIKYFASHQDIDLHEIYRDFQANSKTKEVKVQKLLDYLVSQKYICKKNDLYCSYPWMIDQDLFYILKKSKIDPYFSKKSEKDAQALLEVYKSDIANELKNGSRRDFTDLFTITMDGLKAKDYDDAISLEKKGQNYILYVHIADVSHYVRPGHSLDKDSFKRGNSYYLSKTVIPMLPFQISNEICSLNEGVLRLAMSVIMTLTPKGELISTDFCNSVIRVDKRIPYEIGNEILMSGKKPYYDYLSLCLELKNILYDKRVKNNSIDFELPEIEMEFGDSILVPERITKKIRGETERIIEEFMLIANQSVAKYFEKKGAMLYRVHDKPQEERKEMVYKYLELLGYKLPKDYNQKEINHILMLIRGKQEEKLLTSYILRSMSQAVYSEKNIGHFGLNFQDYTHFTSPIRRYSDLVVHRLLKNSLSREKPFYSVQDLTKIAEHVSTTERYAVEAEREFLKIKGAKFLKRYQSKQFKSFVSGVTEKGIFMELEDYGLEGFIPAFILAREGYSFDSHYICFQKRIDKKLVIKLGDPFVVSIFSINENKGFIDLKIIKKEN